MKGRVETISRRGALNFILPKHYAGRIPSITYAFGWYIQDQIVAVATFGTPASPSLCVGICGEEYKDKVIELNRLVRIDSLDYQLSAFVSACLRRLSVYDLIVVSYADSGMGHHGYVYQATNFLYTGATKERTDKYTPNNKHSRHYKNDDQLGLRKVRTSKYRYVFFATRNKKLKKQYLMALKYEILPYPKGDNDSYILGDYQKPEIVNSDLICPVTQGQGRLF